MELKDYAKDIKLNIDRVLNTEDGSPGLTETQKWGVALASAYQTKNQELIDFIHGQAKEHISEEEINATKIATTLMAMNNIYYRFRSTAENPEFKQMPVKLRMSGLAQHGIDKANFELYALAISALNFCETCINGHVRLVNEHGITNEGVQSSIRIAAVICGAAQALSINYKLGGTK